MQQEQPGNFEQLPLARAEMPILVAGNYRVYSDARQFTRVQADSAVHALEASGLMSAVKIEREALHKNTLIPPHYAAQQNSAASAQNS